MRAFLFPFLILIFSISACSEVKKQQNAEKIIDVFKSNKEISLSKILSIKKYILFKNDSLSFLSRVDKIIKYKKKYFVLDSKQSVLKIYDLSGNYLNDITKIGKGPSEVTKLIDFTIDSTAGKLILYDVGNSSLLFFNLEGKYLNQIDIFPYAMKMGLLCPGKLIFYLGNNYFEESKANNFLVCDYKGKIIGRHLKFDKDECGLFGFGGILSENKEEVLCSNGVSNIIYLIDKEGKVRKKFHFLFQGCNLKEGDCLHFNNEHSKFNLCFLNRRVITINDNVYFDFMNKDKLDRGFIFKDEVFSTSNISKDYFSLIFGFAIGKNDKDLIFLLKPEVVDYYFSEYPDLLNKLKIDNRNLFDVLESCLHTESQVLIFANFKDN